MRHGTSNNRRQRGRGNGGGHSSGRGGNNQRSKVFDSNGPDVRIRGTAHQVSEKYAALAKDAAAIGDRIISESYLQHAEHYQRVINSWVQDSAKTATQDVRSEEGAQPKTENSSAPKVPQENDLSLPSSILGGDVKVESSAERTAETTAS